MLREELDPELHTLRSVIRTIVDPKARADAESARFNLYAALDDDDAHLARRWSRAVRAAMVVGDPVTGGTGYEALDHIDGLLMGSCND